MYIRLNVNHACMRVCVCVYALFLCSIVYVNGLCGDPTSPQSVYVLFYCSVSFNFSLIII